MIYIALLGEFSILAKDNVLTFSMYRVSKKRNGHFCRGGESGRYAPPTGHNAHGYFATVENLVWSVSRPNWGAIAIGQHLLLVLIIIEVKTPDPS